jgi:hypothetical protein
VLAARGVAPTQGKRPPSAPGDGANGWQVATITVDDRSVSEIALGFMWPATHPSAARSPNAGDPDGDRPAYRTSGGTVALVTLLLLLAGTVSLFLWIFKPLTDSIGACGGG